MFYATSALLDESPPMNLPILHQKPQVEEVVSGAAETKSDATSRNINTSARNLFFIFKVII